MKVQQRKLDSNGQPQLFTVWPKGMVEKGDELIGYCSPGGVVKIRLAPDSDEGEREFPRLTKGRV